MWDTIVGNVTRDLQAIRTQSGLSRIYITGISLGGGLSVIAYNDVKKSNIFSTV
jgi:hypothetical protein